MKTLLLLSLLFLVGCQKKENLLEELERAKKEGQVQEMKVYKPHYNQVASTNVLIQVVEPYTIVKFVHKHRWTKYKVTFENNEQVFTEMESWSEDVPLIPEFELRKKFHDKGLDQHNSSY